MEKVKMKFKPDYYGAICATKDKALIRMFWAFFRHHRLSKNHAARCVLLHYYSTTATPAPVFIRNLFLARRQWRIVKNAEQATKEFYGVL